MISFPKLLLVANHYFLHLLILLCTLIIKKEVLFFAYLIQIYNLPNVLSLLLYIYHRYHFRGFLRNVNIFVLSELFMRYCCCQISYPEISCVPTLTWQQIQISCVTSCFSMVTISYFSMAMTNYFGYALKLFQ